MVKWFGTNTDITDQLRTQDDLKAKEASLREAVKARDEFLSIASHELRTPITSLQLQLQMAKRAISVEENKMPSPAKLLKTFDISIIQVSRLTNLIENLLDISRIQSGRIQYDFKEIDLTKLVNEVTALHCTQLKLVECKIGLPKEPISVNCDPFRLEQVLINLLTNAAKYGLGKPIEISVTQDQTVAKITVRDQGMGIAQELHEKIFDRFERAVNHDNISGLGLGLYISKSIVIAHHGKLKVESELGKGSTFIVELPLGRKV